MVRLKSRVLAVVAAIPEGRLTTYGIIAQHLHVTARQVAFILATLTVEESERLPAAAAKALLKKYLRRKRNMDEPMVRNCAGSLRTIINTPDTSG